MSDTVKLPQTRIPAAPVKPKPLLPGALFPRTRKSYTLDPNVKVRVVYDKSWVPVLGQGFALQTQDSLSLGNWTTQAYGPILDLVRANPAFQVSSTPETYAYKQILNIPDSWLDGAQIAEKNRLASVVSRYGPIDIPDRIIGSDPAFRSRALIQYSAGKEALAATLQAILQSKKAKPLGNSYFMYAPLHSYFVDALTPPRSTDDAYFLVSFPSKKQWYGESLPGVTYIAYGRDEDFRKVNSVDRVVLERNGSLDPVLGLKSVRIDFPNTWKMAGVEQFYFTS